MSDLGGQRVLPAEALGALPIPDTVDCVVGATATLLTRPTNARTALVLLCDKGGFRVRLGDYHASGMPGAINPGASVTDGSAGVLVAEGASVVLGAPEKITVKGYAADSVLTYYWL